MDYFAGLDVSVKQTSVCIVDDTGKIVREVKVPSEPKALLKVLKNPAYRFKRIGLEAGPLSQWLYSALADRPRRKASWRWRSSSLATVSRARCSLPHSQVAVENAKDS